MKTLFRYFWIFLLSTGISRGQINILKDLTPAPLPKGAEFSSIAVSRFGDIYLLENKRHEIYRLKDDGKILNVNGGYGWGEGQFDTPVDISIASGLDLIVADYNNHRIVRFDRDLNYITSYPDPNSDYQLSFPRSVILSVLGEIFILEDENSEIVRLNIRQNDITVFAGIEYGRYSLMEPQLIRMTKSGLITVLEKSGKLLQFDRYGAPMIQLSASIESEVLSMVLINDDVLITLAKEQYLLYYSKSLDEWFSPVISGLDVPRQFIAGTYKNDQLYLLHSSGRILICAVDKSVR
ncbi:MAG: hypothetical protein L6422_11735 [Candidatus Marinimicrobia bacterium]|nr:hypothetical protein [Candidatus Neomarinimicrobiota bacterium]